MIGSIRGTLLAYDKDPDKLLIEAGDIGYWVYVTPKDLAAAISSHSGSSSSDEQPAGLFYYTEQIVREDAVALYGFQSQLEHQSFTILISISGIGPQMALAVLSTFSPSELQTVLLDEDIDSLCLVPGIGPKRARQLLAVLKDRFAISDLGFTAPTQLSSTRAEVRAALSELGYSTEEIHQALSDVSNQISDDASTETVLKAALTAIAQ